MRGVVRAVVAFVLFAGSAWLPVGAQTAEDLPADSLAALSGLVEAADCSLGDALDGDAANGLALPYWLCDDGLPPAGGGEGAIPVPVAYQPRDGDDWSGLPAPADAERAAQAAAEDDLRPEEGNRISLDVDVTLPPSATALAHLGGELPRVLPRPKGGWPVLVFMHGCCGGNKRSWEATNVDAAGERWHHSNAWFASRGYVVVTYTARGFRNNQDRGSTGTTQLDSRRYEINDYQYLVGLLADHDAARRAAGERPVFDVNPRRIGVVGGSYGGGFSWLALTDPTWRSAVARVPMRLAAAVPKYGWTDLVEALVPSGHYRDGGVAPTDPATALSRDPIGVVKHSIVSGLYASGNLLTGDHTTFPDHLDEAFARLQQGEPYEGDPVLESTATQFLNDRSAYFQNRFFARVGKGLRVPVFSAATWTDPLFPTMEHMRFQARLEKVAPGYPIRTYLGDYQHFVQNKPKEWGDMCGEDHHVCTVADFTRADGSVNLMKSDKRVRTGINTRINYFLDYHLRGKGRKPSYDVTATTTICPANATEVLKADEPGIEYRAPSWAALRDGSKTFGWSGGGTTSSVATDGHSAESDPVARDRSSDKCFTPASPNPGPGVVVYESPPLKAPLTMMGLPRFTSEHSTTATNYWIAVRMFDEAPDGQMTMVTRGVCRFDSAHPQRKCDSFDLFGNAWLFGKDHRVVLEVTQADSPFLRRHNIPSTITFQSANVRLPLADPARRVDFRL